MQRCYDPTCPDCRPSSASGISFDISLRRCDAQLQLIGPNREPGAHLEYIVTLDDSTRHAGSTDDRGRTRRIETRLPVAFRSITLAPSLRRTQQECCGWDIVHERVDIPLSAENLTTRCCGAGTSVDTVKLPAPSRRGLTSGELAMARTVFGDGLNYKTILIHSHGWWLFMGMQDRNTAVTPNGKMYFPKDIYKPDFSESDTSRALFMHEMTHVWQHQMGYGVKTHGLTVTSRGRSAYMYQLTSDSHLSDFNMEQQGNIISDYYMICVYKHPFAAYNQSMSSDLLQRVMAPLLENPRDKTLLPR